MPRRHIGKITDTPEGAEGGLEQSAKRTRRTEDSDEEEKTAMKNIFLDSGDEEDSDDEENTIVHKNIRNITNGEENVSQGRDTSKGEEDEGHADDKWDLQHIFTIEEITRTDPLPQECMTKSCPLPACSKYVQLVDQTSIWYSCLDCQEQDFGGWPEELNEYPVNFLTMEHRNIMKDLCTAKNSIAMPNIPINENGVFANDIDLDEQVSAETTHETVEGNEQGANAISHSQAVDSPTCESTGCCSGAPRPNFVPDHILDSASGTPGEGLSTLPLVDKRRYVIVKWIPLSMNLYPCMICNQPFMTNEMIFYYQNMPILHARPEMRDKRRKFAYMHPQCCTQTCTVHGISHYVCADHINFLKNCVSVENVNDELIPLHENAELFTKLSKILQKNFYADADVVKCLPKVLYYDSKDNPNVESNVETNVESSDEANVESSNEANVESSVESSGESSVESSGESNVEKWELEKILTTEEILHHNSKKCSTNNCKLPACTRYVNTADENDIWYGCIDCQYKEFGGWPNKTDEFPVEFFAEEDLDTMKEQCSSNGSFEYPLNIPIKTSTGEFVNFESNDKSSERNAIPAYRNKLVVCGKPVLFEGVSLQKRNDRNDDVFFCDCGAGECWEILQKNTSSLYQDKDYLVAYCRECDSRPRICKKCHHQFSEQTYSDHLEGRCQDNQKIIPNVQTIYSCDVNRGDIRSVVREMFRNEKSILSDILEKYTIYDVGVTNHPEKRIPRSMGLHETKDKMFARFVDNYEYVHAVGIEFVNVEPEKNVNMGRMIEQCIYEELVHSHAGVCLSSPEYFGQGITETRNNDGLEKFVGYIIAAKPKHNHSCKREFCNGRVGREKEKKFVKEREAEMQKYQVSAINDNVESLGGRVQSMDRKLTAVDSKLDSIVSSLKQAKNKDVEDITVSDDGELEG